MMVVTPEHWQCQSAGVLKVVVTPEEQCPCNSSIPRTVVTPGRCCAGQDILCGARAIGAADSAMALWVSCPERTRGAMGVTGLGGLPSQTTAEAPAGPLWQATGQAGLGDQLRGSPHVLPVPRLLGLGLAPLG